MVVTAYPGKSKAAKAKRVFVASNKAWCVTPVAMAIMMMNKYSADGIALNHLYKATQEVEILRRAMISNPRSHDSCVARCNVENHL